MLIGNGRLGACVYGELLREQLVLNETSMWSGSPEEADRPGAAAYLPQIRQLLREGKHAQAQQLFGEHFTCAGRGTNFAHGTDVPFGCYQLAGRLLISHFQATGAGRQDTCCVQDYTRTLDLARAVATVSFTLGGKRFTREYITSGDRQAVYVHLTCSEKGQIDFSCGLDRDERFLLERSGSALLMTGQLEDGYGTDKGVRYACAMDVKTLGGRIIREPMRTRVEGADEAWIAVTVQTDLAGFMGKMPCEPRSQALGELQAALDTDWEEALRLHSAWYAPQYESMTLHLSDEPLRPVMDMLRDAREGKLLPELMELYVNFARYQMICSSQPGGFAANLQGLWSDEILTPWNGDWHLNAQQMIYWLVERANLSHCHEPYLKLTGELVAPGEKTAQAYYGARGWLVHTCTNPWGFTSPCEDASWGSTTGSPAWQCHHLWEHYLFTLDEEYLAWAYPIMKGAMLFYLDNMIENERGFLVTSPSSSPENWFIDDHGDQVALCEGPAYDRELILALADSCIRACEILGADGEFLCQLRDVLPRLAPVETGSDGRIMEWSREFREPLPYHRHLSHLWGVYPGSLISKEKTPALGAAAEKTLQGRGKTTAGWAVAFRGCLHARLRHAWGVEECFTNAMKYATAYNLMNLAAHCDETLDNPPALDLERCRYPFQIDGNQGVAAMLLMMLLDDDLSFTPQGPVTELYLLSALPGAIASGCVSGLKAKGGLTVSLTWENGRVRSLTLKGKPGSRAVVHAHDGERTITLAEDALTLTWD